MFNKFDRKESVHSFSKVRSSVQRTIRSQIIDQYPLLQKHEDLQELLLPRKDDMYLAKCEEHVQMVVINNKPLFFQIRGGHWVPHLLILHMYPSLLPHMQVDRGAVKFVLGGANIMCPGLTSPGARMDSVGKDAIVAIMVEGKQHAMAIGRTLMSTKEIEEINQGHGIETIHYLDDGLWRLGNAFD